MAKRLGIGLQTHQFHQAPFWRHHVVKRLLVVRLSGPGLGELSMIISPMWLLILKIYGYRTVELRHWSSERNIISPVDSSWFLQVLSSHSPLGSENGGIPGIITPEIVTIFAGETLKWLPKLYL